VPPRFPSEPKRAQRSGLCCSSNLNVRSTARLNARSGSSNVSGSAARCARTRAAVEEKRVVRKNERSFRRIESNRIESNRVERASSKRRCYSILTNVPALPLYRFFFEPKTREACLSSNLNARSVPRRSLSNASRMRAVVVLRT
jgi:hypothetical protein